MRDLVIAPPAPDLAYQQAEVQAIINSLHADVLLDHVDLRSVIEVLSQPHRYVFIVAHGSADGIYLEGDEFLSTSTLVQLLRATPPELLAINTCKSISTAVRVHEECKVSCVSTIIDVPDLEAYVTMARFAEALGQGMDIATAYRTSKPDANRTYVLMNGTPRLNANSRYGDVGRMLLQVYAKLDAIDERLRILEDQQAQHPQPNALRVLAFIIGWTLLGAPFAMHLGRSTSEFAWAVLLFVLSALCFAYVFGYISPGGYHV